MNKTKIKKRETPEEKATNQTLIMFVLTHTNTPKNLSELSKDIEQPTNLTFYHIQELKKKHLILETDDKKYTCQPLLQGENSENLDDLLMVMIRILIKDLVLPEDITLRQLEKAVVNNLTTYIENFKLEII